MKILLITPRFYPEPFSITCIAEELCKMGHQITVLTGMPNYGKWKIYENFKSSPNEFHNGIRIIRINEKVRKKGVLGLIINYLSIYVGFKKRLKKMHSDFDIVFSHLLSPILSISYAGKYCKKHNLPHFIYGLDLWPESLAAAGYFKKNSIIFSYFKSLSKKIYNSANLISYASPSVENYLRDYLKVSVPFKHIYQPCLTTKPPFNLISNHSYRKEGKIHILYCGTISKFIHLDLMIKALSDDYIKDNIVFDIVGSGSDFDNIKEMVAEEKLEQCVIFHGRVTPEETKQFYYNCDVCFVPLYINSETSKMIPQKLIECLMYGRPIFGMIGGDGQKIIREASTNNFISGQTPEEIREVLIKIINTDSNLLYNCGLENRKYFDRNKRFSIGTVCEELEECMLDLIKKK